MSRLSKITGYLSDFAAKAAPPVPRQGDYPQWALDYAGGQRYNMPRAEDARQFATLYEKLTWLATAIDRIGETCAPVRFSVKRRVGEDSEDIPNHDFELRLANPNEMQSGGELVRDFIQWYKLTGTAYIHMPRSGPNAPPAELWVVPTPCITPIPDGKSYIAGYQFDDGQGHKQTLQTWEVCQVKNWNPGNQFVGLSAVKSLSIIGMGDLAQQRYQLAMFDKDNARIPGALAFSANIGNEPWKAMKEEANAQWGGTNRKGPMMLRGVGAGGVQWVAMGLTQKEMEFLESRRETKEEFWGKLVPGYASMVAVNATEANAIAGKATFMELVIYPTLWQVGQAWSKHILPAYGPDIYGEFDDVRQTNRLTDLQEQAEYGKTHTIDEVRSKYYGDAPIGDARGGQLVGQSGGQPSATAQSPDVPPAANEPMAKAELTAWENYALKRVGQAGGREFEARHVHPLQAERVRGALRGAKSAADVRAVFDKERKTGSGRDVLADALKAVRDILG